MEFLPVADEKKGVVQTQSVVLAGKGVVIPSGGECPEPFSKTAFTRIGMCRGI